MGIRCFTRRGLPGFRSLLSGIILYYMSFYFILFIVLYYILFYLSYYIMFYYIILHYIMLYYIVSYRCIGSVLEEDLDEDFSVRRPC